MSITAICNGCKARTVDHSETICPFCDSKLSGRYRVKFKAKGGRWRTKTVKGLPQARLVEAQFQDQRDVEVERRLSLTDAWTLYYEAHHRTKRSINHDEDRFRIYLLPKLGSLRLDQIKPGMVTDVLGSMKAQGCAPATRMLVLALLSTIYSWAIRHELCTDNPCRRVDRIKVDNARKRVLGPEEVHRFLGVLSAWPKRSMALLLRFLLLTGLRSGQAKALRWDWIDMGKGVATFPREATKNGKGQILPLSGAALEVLKAVDKRGSIVFHGVTNVSRAFQQVAKAAGIEGAVCHDLRRSFGSWAVSNGVDIYTVSKLLGHSSVTITERIYAHLSLGTLRSGAEVVGKAFAGYSSGG
jgi:integrase